MELAERCRLSGRPSVREFPDGRIPFVKECFCECKNVSAVDGEANEKYRNRLRNRIPIAKALFGDSQNKRTFESGEKKVIRTACGSGIQIANAFFGKFENEHTVDGGERNKHANRSLRLLLDGTVDPSVRVGVACGDQGGLASSTSRNHTVPSMSLKATLVPKTMTRGYQWQFAFSKTNKMRK